MEPEEKSRERRSGHFRLCRIVVLTVALIILLGVALLGLNVLKGDSAGMTDSSIQSLLVQGDFKSKKISPDQLQDLLGMYYAQEPLNYGSLKALADEGKRVLFLANHVAEGNASLDYYESTTARQISHYSFGRNSDHGTS